MIKNIKIPLKKGTITIKIKLTPPHQIIKEDWTKLKKIIQNLF
jgi:hypothetical protein